MSIVFTCEIGHDPEDMKPVKGDKGDPRLYECPLCHNRIFVAAKVIHQADQAAAAWREAQEEK